ncbi:hypothetical protein GGI19_003138 [Coemansia pectinata]|uniref:Methylosome subunit pICln n=1 Tax=Coemansia pectinata TaxID=1052879 RepID=A0A9W8GW34_9FUNG|nr:hypothetical protein GGI19_003138 [Coemansia pectinata]KAJ2870317.1 hypothetical protein GGH93_005668 [Coemansia aciculifera]
MPVTLLSQLPTLSHTRFTADRTRVASDPPSDSANGLGTLYVDEQRLVFFSTEASRGFSIDYPTVVIHAVSRGTDGVGAHLYCQLDGPFPSSNKPDSNDEEDDDEQFGELRFIPEDEKLLDDMFKAMSDCAALNPDDEGSGSESDLDDICVGDYQDGTANGDEEGNDDEYDDESAVQTIEELDSSEFITTADDLDRLTAKGKEILAHLESVIIEPTEQANGSNEDGRYDDAE